MGKKRGMFKKGFVAPGIDADMTRRALAGAYAVHGMLFKKEAIEKSIKKMKDKKEAKEKAKRLANKK